MEPENKNTFVAENPFWQHARHHKWSIICLRILFELTEHPSLFHYCSLLQLML